jgi:uncharacterized protein YbjT (DUF2867 family)
MRIAVIGAYGLIGSYVAARLLADGHEVIGIGRDITTAARRSGSNGRTKRHPAPNAVLDPEVPRPKPPRVH